MSDPRDLQQRHAEQQFAEQLVRRTPRPLATYVLVAINVAVWLANVVTGVDPLGPGAESMWRWGGNWLPATREQPWRLVTATFLHAGLMHLALNMWALYQTGMLAERFFGTRQFVLLYLASGVLGSVSSLFFGARDTVSVGASGAIFGVIGGLLAAIYTKSNHLPPRLVTQLKGALLPWVLLTLGLGFVSMLHLDNSAHLGGLAAGLMMGTMMPGKLDPRDGARRAWPRTLLAAALAAGVGVLAWWLVPPPSIMLN